MVINPDEYIPPSVDEISSDLLENAVNYMRTPEFFEIFQKIGQIDAIPKLSFQQMRLIKTEYIDRFCHPGSNSPLTNSAKILASWLDAILEFTVLKYEALINTVKKKNSLINSEWPLKKMFIERAYKILLFTKRVKPEINLTMEYLRDNNLYDFMSKENMNKNKVYLKIKEIEKKEHMLLEQKKEIEACTHWLDYGGQTDQTSSVQMANGQAQSETDNPVAQENHIENTDQSNIGHSNEMQIQTDEIVDQDDHDEVEIQTQQMEPHEHHTQSRDRQVEVHEQNEEVINTSTQPQEEEHKILSEGDESRDENSDTENDPNGWYNSISERYHVQVMKNKRRRDREARKRAQPSDPSQRTEYVRSQMPEQSQQQENGEQDGMAEILSTQLFGQILALGDVFQNQVAEKVGEELQNIKGKYLSIWYEHLFQSRIFLADRHEKVERALQKAGLIPKDNEDSPDNEWEDFDFEEMGEILESKLQDPEILSQIHQNILDEEENEEI